MSAITKPELVRINSQLAADNAALRAQVAQLKADLDAANCRERDTRDVAQRLEAELADANSAFLEAQDSHASVRAENERLVAIIETRSTMARAARPLQSWQIERAAAMALAREEAMRSGRCVKA